VLEQRHATAALAGDCRAEQAGRTGSDDDNVELARRGQVQDSGWKSKGEGIGNRKMADGF